VEKTKQSANFALCGGYRTSLFSVTLFRPTEVILLSDTEGSTYRSEQVGRHPDEVLNSGPKPEPSRLCGRSHATAQ